MKLATVIGFLLGLFAADWPRREEWSEPGESYDNRTPSKPADQVPFLDDEASTKASTKEHETLKRAGDMVSDIKQRIDRLKEHSAGEDECRTIDRLFKEVLALLGTLPPDHPDRPRLQKTVRDSYYYYIKVKGFWHGSESSIAE